MELKKTINELLEYYSLEDIYNYLESLSKENEFEFMENRIMNELKKKTIR